MAAYDKAIKENITAVLLTFSEKLLGFTFKNPTDLPKKVQVTIEIDPDFLKKLPSGRLHLPYSIPKSELLKLSGNRRNCHYF